MGRRPDEVFWVVTLVGGSLAFEVFVMYLMIAERWKRHRR